MFEMWFVNGTKEEFVDMFETEEEAQEYIDDHEWEETQEQYYYYIEIENN